ncbi:MAG: serine/threonine-protein kinase, partial [Gemmataceae bacterium]
MTSGDTNLSEHEQRVDEAIAAYLDAIGRGEVVERSAFLARYPELAEELAAFLVDHERFRMFAGPLPGLGELGSLSTLDNAIQITAPTPRSPGDLPHRLDDYELVAEIARGGMGIVYKARQLSLHRIVALKMILAGRQASPSDVQRFRAEAELAASLDHPSIVPIYEVNSCEGIPFFSMKLIEGSNLAARDPRWQQDPRAAAKLVAQVARAVHHAHQRGLLHRDLKPANVLLDDQDHPYVTDFGLAKLLQHDDSITPSGGIVGTPRYMAPEQLKPRGPLTTASDVHGLGCILFEILTGRPAFPAASPAEALRTILEVEVDRPGTLNPRVPLDLETICLKCLEKEPGRRYSSAEALAEDLERFLQHEPIHARQISRAGRLLRWGRRRPVVAG